ncbi:unnamed protein product [Didymodactylos carnosus]|uniref:peptidylprolyl isomerase n=1 Tax=Didymodactylos carnosus TaxID=1234261 RepID=A0A8S2CKM2_9BILA|nr:unnamed protein product [Didymodactylos carnosus]CAF3500806.1 unnamed protein product [Didymodactylos carnosus]
MASQGFNVEVIKEGSGDKPKNGQKVSVHYTGRLTNGTKFDSSSDRGKPSEFKLGEGKVIKGWDQGVAQMSKGEQAKITLSREDRRVERISLRVYSKQPPAFLSLSNR